LLLAAIDGRNFDRALGMTLSGVARLLATLGCHAVVNLDGGSSKRMVLRGETLDLASTEIRSGDGSTQMRPVHTGLLLFSRS
jgi:exopolysaccharide biosynthesis protein